MNIKIIPYIKDVTLVKITKDNFYYFLETGKHINRIIKFNDSTDLHVFYDKGSKLDYYIEIISKDFEIDKNLLKSKIENILIFR